MNHTYTPTCLLLSLFLLFGTHTLIGQSCPGGVSLTMGNMIGANMLSPGDPVCRGGTLSISIHHSTVFGISNDFAIYWSTDGTYATANQVYVDGILIEDNISPSGGNTTMASDWLVDLTGVGSFYLYVVLDPNNPQPLCDPPLSFLLNLAEVLQHPLDVIVCEADEADFDALLSYDQSLTHYRWMVDIGSGYFAVPNSPPFSGVFSDHMSINPISAAMDGWDFKLRIRYGLSPSNFYCELQSDSGNLSVTPLPDTMRTVFPAGQNVCNGQQATITIASAENGITYLLRNPSGTLVDCGTGNGSNLVFSFYPSESGSYSIEAGMGICGANPVLVCPAMLTTEPFIQIRNINAASIGADETICEEAPTQLLDGSSSFADGGLAGYIWQSSITGPASGFGPANGNNSLPMYSEAFINQDTWYRLVFTVNFGDVFCFDTSNVVGISLNEVAAGMIQADQTICAGDQPMDLQSTTGGNGNGSGTIRYRYIYSTDLLNWNSTGNYSPATDYSFPTVPDESTWFMRVCRSTYQGKLCYDSSNVVLLTVDSLPIVEIDPAGPFCSEDLPELITKSLSPPGGTQFWSGTGIINPNSGLFDPEQALIGINTVTIDYTHPISGCLTSESMDVWVHQNPHLQDTSTAACEGDIVDYISLSNDLSGLSTPSFEYYYTLNDALNGINSISPQEIFFVAGNYTRYYRRLSNGCMDVAIIQVNILPPPSTSGLSLSFDPPRVCQRDSANLMLCGLVPNTSYSIGFHSDQSAPKIVQVFSDGQGCAVLSRLAYPVVGTYDWRVESLFFDSGCGISPDPIPPNLQAQLIVHGRPEIPNLTDEIQSPFCYAEAPDYQLLNLPANTAFSIQYELNGNSETFSGTTNGSGELAIPLSPLTENASILVLGLAYDDGDTQCAADPPPNLSKQAIIRPDLSLIELFGDTFCESPDAEARLLLSPVPDIGELLEFTLRAGQDQFSNTIPLNHPPDFYYEIPFGKNVEESQNYSIEIASLAYRNSPKCRDDSTRAEATIRVMARPEAHFDESGKPCFGQLREVVNLSLPEANRGEFQYQWIYQDSVISTEQNLDYLFNERDEFLDLLLIASAANCTDSIDGQIEFDLSGPEIPEILVVRKEGDPNSAVLVADVPGYSGAELDALEYQWYEQSQHISGANLRYLHVAQYSHEQKAYVVGVKDPQGSDCESFSEQRRLKAPETDVIEAGLTLFPNPSNGQFQVLISGKGEGQGQLHIMDMQGRIVMLQKIEKGEGPLNLKMHTRLPKGIYVLSWITTGQTPLYQTFIIE